MAISLWWVVCYLWNSQLEEEGHPASSSYFRLGMAKVPGFWLNHVWFGVIKMDASACCHPNHPGNALTNDCWEWFNGDRWLVWWYLVICKWDTHNWEAHSKYETWLCLISRIPWVHTSKLSHSNWQFSDRATSYCCIYTHIRPTGFSRCVIRRNPSI